MEFTLNREELLLLLKAVETIRATFGAIDMPVSKEKIRQLDEISRKLERMLAALPE